MDLDDHPSYNALIAADGLQAVDIALKQRPAMILMDVAMPGIDGLACLDLLRRHHVQARSNLTMVYVALLAMYYANVWSGANWSNAIAVWNTAMVLWIGALVLMQDAPTALGAQPEASPIELHPNLAELYRRKVGELDVALNDESIKTEASELLRSLIDTVVLTREAGAPSGLKAELHGDLASILSLCQSGARKEKLSGAGASESQLSVVAGERNQLYLQPFWSKIPVVSRPLTAANSGSNPGGRQFVFCQ